MLKIKIVKDLVNKLSEYCLEKHYAGYDPFDGLNSKLFKKPIFYKNSFTRLAWLQFFKRSLINFRSLALVEKQFNSKAGALFLLGVLRGSVNVASGEAAIKLFESLKNNVIKTKSGSGFGYNFDWQAKAFFVPKGTPNTVTSVYVGQALLDYDKAYHSEEARNLAENIKNFLINEMIMWEKEGSLCFSYIPDEKAEVHNANLLSAAYLSRLFFDDKSSRLQEIVRKSVAYSLKDIAVDGYWPYGARSHHRWMDNFHTGFNLECLLDVRRNIGTDEYDNAIKKVYGYFVRNFFLADGTPKYLWNKLYPIDIHTIAEDIILFSKIAKDNSGLFAETEKDKAEQLAHSIMNIAINTFWDKKRHLFYYQKHRFFMNKIPYMRWSQSWMFYALSVYLEKFDESKN